MAKDSGSHHPALRALDALVRPPVDALVSLGYILARLVSRVSAEAPEWAATAHENRESLQRIESLLGQSLEEIRIAHANSPEVVQDPKVYELLERISSQLESGASPPAGQEISELLGRICDLLEDRAVPVPQANALHQNPRWFQELSDVFCDLDAQLQDVARRVFKSRGYDLAPKEMRTVLVSLDQLRSFERSRSEESKWHSNAHLFAGGALGILVNWATSQNQEISDISLVIVGFFVFIAGYCFLSAKNWHRTVEEHKIDETGSKDDSHDKAIRPTARSSKGKPSSARPSGGSKKTPRRARTRGRRASGEPEGDRGDAG